MGPNGPQLWKEIMLNTFEQEDAFGQSHRGVVMAEWRSETPRSLSQKVDKKIVEACREFPAIASELAGDLLRACADLPTPPGCTLKFAPFMFLHDEQTRECRTRSSAVGDHDQKVRCGDGVTVDVYWNNGDTSWTTSRFEIEDMYGKREMVLKGNDFMSLYDMACMTDDDDIKDRVARVISFVEGSLEKKRRSNLPSHPA